MSEMFYATPNQLYMINKLTHLLSGSSEAPSASLPISKSDADALIKNMVKAEILLGNTEAKKPKRAKSAKCAKKVSPVRDGEIKVIKISI